jgi:hypothetical protein
LVLKKKREENAFAELEAEGGEPELVEQLSGQLAADSRAVLEVVTRNVKTVP